MIKGAILLTALLLAGCATTPPPSAPSPTGSVTTTPTGPVTTDCGEELRAELLAMLERDQAGRLGGVDEEGDQARTERLEVVISECGWPTISMVGEDGEDAAWAIAQHSDLDPEFQERALELLRAAGDDVSPGNVAYLDDRVRAGRGEPQKYGTQVACVDGDIGPANGFDDEGAVDELRAEAGLEPLEEYYASFGPDFCTE